MASQLGRNRIRVPWHTCQLFRAHWFTQAALVLLQCHLQDVELGIRIHQLREHLSHQLLVCDPRSIHLGKIFGTWFDLKKEEKKRKEKKRKEKKRKEKKRKKKKKKKGSNEFQLRINRSFSLTFCSNLIFSSTHSTFFLISSSVSFIDSIMSTKSRERKEEKEEKDMVLTSANSGMIHSYGSNKRWKEREPVMEWAPPWRVKAFLLRAASFSRILSTFLLVSSNFFNTGSYCFCNHIFWVLSCGSESKRKERLQGDFFFVLPNLVLLLCQTLQQILSSIQDLRLQFKLLLQILNGFQQLFVLNLRIKPIK